MLEKSAINSALHDTSRLQFSTQTRSDWGGSQPSSQKVEPSNTTIINTINERRKLCASFPLLYEQWYRAEQLARNTRRERHTRRLFFLSYAIPSLLAALSISYFSSCSPPPAIPAASTMLPKSGCSANFPASSSLQTNRKGRSVDQCSA